MLGARCPLLVTVNRSPLQRSQGQRSRAAEDLRYRDRLDGLLAHSGEPASPAPFLRARKLWRNERGGKDESRVGEITAGAGGLPTDDRGIGSTEYCGIEKLRR